MVSVDSKRTEETMKWDIPSVFINYEFSNFLNNTFPLAECGVERDVRAITGFGSVDEWADHYELYYGHGITLDAILKLLKEKDCLLEVNKKENYLKYHHQNVEYLRVEIEARIKK
jgi:hypothetical protein